MLGYIYAITNTINGKIYIGQTVMTPTQRWNKHVSQSRTDSPTGIAGALKKYGIESFTMEIICEANSDIELNALEQFYIQEFDSFNNGYNLTLGGDGGKTLQLNEEEVIAKYWELKTIKAVAAYFNCGVLAISNILHKNNIKIAPPGNGMGGQRFKEGDGVKPVKIVETGQVFPSLKECSQWLIDNGYSKANSMEMARKSLSRCLNGERKSYCKLHFQYI